MSAAGLRVVAAAGCILVTLSAAFAAEEPTTSYLPGRSYEQEGVRWSDQFSRFGPHEYACPKRTRKCFNDALVIRNESDGDIRCAVSVIYPQPNEAGITNVEGFEVIGKGKERSVVQSLNVPAKLEPISFGSKCAALPALVPLDIPAECKLQILNSPIPSDFYPPISIRRNEQGSVVVEFAVAEPSGKANDIVVARSSEHADLDAAAVKLIGQMTLSSACSAQRYRLTIPFRLSN